MGGNNRLSTHKPKWRQGENGKRVYIPCPPEERVTTTIGHNQYKKASPEDGRGGDHRSRKFREGRNGNKTMVE